MPDFRVGDRVKLSPKGIDRLWQTMPERPTFRGTVTGHSTLADCLWIKWDHNKKPYSFHADFICCADEVIGNNSCEVLADAEPRMTDFHRVALELFAGPSKFNSWQIARALAQSEARVATAIAEALAWTREARKRA